MRRACKLAVLLMAFVLVPMSILPSCSLFRKEPKIYKDFGEDEPYRITFTTEEEREGCVAVVEYNPYYEGTFTLKFPDTDPNGTPVTKVDTNARGEMPQYVMKEEFEEFLTLMEEYYGITYEEARILKDSSNDPRQPVAMAFCKCMSFYVYRDIDEYSSDRLREEVMEAYPITSKWGAVYVLDPTAQDYECAELYCFMAKADSEKIKTFGYEALLTIEAFDLENSVDDHVLARCMQTCTGFGTGVTDIEWPAYVQEIGDAFFMGCTSLTKVTIPATVTKVGRDVSVKDDAEAAEGVAAFAGCTLLEEIAFSEGVTSIENVIMSCDNVKTVYLPASLKHLGSLSGENGTMTQNFPAIHYAGTVAQWNELFKDEETGDIQYGDYANLNVHCSDGVIATH